MADIFLSYSRKDTDFMQRTRDYLRDRGLTVWTDESLTPGTSAWTRAIEQAIRTAQLVVVILSPDAKDSDWVERELAIAQDSCRIPVFPILLRGDEHTSIHFRLAVTQFADARRDVGKALAQLANSITTYLSRPAASTRSAPPPALVASNEPSVVVAKVGTADFRTIGEALKTVAEGTTIIVREGLYRENLLLSKPLEIIGEGEREEIILESNSVSCITMDTDYARLHGLTILLRVGLSDEKYFAVDVPKGRLILENCDITSDSWANVGIHGKYAVPVLHNCAIHHSKSGGVFIHEEGAGLIQDCDIFANALAGIEIKTNANPMVHHCNIHNNIAGVLIWENGVGLIKDCEIFANAYSGIEIRRGGTPTVRGCISTKNAQNGIFVHENGAGFVENCDFRGNRNKACMIHYRSNVKLQNNKK